MDPRRWWLLAVAVPAVLACAAAAATPALRDLGDLAVVLVGLFASAVLWSAGGRQGRSRAWRLFAVAPLLPVAGAFLASVLPVSDPLDVVVVRWLPTVPGYGVAIVALLCLAGRSRLRAGGARAAAEAALFLTSSLVAVRLLVAGPVGDWAGMVLAEQVVLGAAVVVTSATMTAALVLLGVVEPARRRMAVVLLAGTALLTSGRGLATGAVLADAVAPAAAARFLVVAGLLLLALAVLLDPGSTAPAPRRFSRSVDVGQLLPMAALLVAVAAAGVVRFLGQHLDVVTWAGLMLAVALALVQRWTTACQEHHLSARLRRSEAYFRSLVHSGTDAVVLLDDDLRVVWSSPALERVLGAAAGRLVGQPLIGAAHPEDQPVLGGALAAGTGAPSLVALRLQDADGVWRCLEAGIADLRDDPDVGAVVLQCRDMTEREARERSLLSVAYTDPMTGLPNRAGMLRLLGERLSAPPVDGQEPGTLLVVELDGVLAAREHAGRDVLGTVVAEIGRRLRSTVRGEDVVARMGGGTFAVLAEGQGADADRLAGRILSVVEQPIVTAAGIIDLTADVGLVELEEGLAVEDLLVRGDLAVRAAAATGPGTAQRYRADLGEAAARHDRLREDLRAARSRGELFLLFQPVVALADQRVAAVEAMLRWRHPTLGEILPAEFLPIAEQSGLIGELQRFALEEATKAAAGLPESASAVRVAVDAPAGYVATGAMIADVEQALRASGLAPERLVLEIGAATVTSPEERDGLDVSTLRLMGVHVALAGFGGDSSMLTHLTKLPIDTVKLDRAFVSRIDRDPKTRALCESVVGIGRALGMSVVAEGVETAAQLAVLAGFGCDFAQGFLLARPMPLEQLARLFSADAGALWPGLVASR